MKIFISHRSENKALIREIKSYFPAWIDCWLDEDKLLLGSDLESNLRDVISEDVDYVIAFIDEKAINSSWLRQEVLWALQKEEELGRTFLLPVLLMRKQELLVELGLQGRICLIHTDYSKESSKFTAQKIVEHVGGWLTERIKTIEVKRSNSIGNSLRALLNILENHLEATPIEWQPQVETLIVKPFLRKAMMSQIGEIALDSKQYYSLLFNDISNATHSWNIDAVATLHPQLWDDNENQRYYEQLNIKAVENKAAIRRLFILTRGSEERYREIICRQLNAGINIRVAYKESPQVSHLRDMAYFKGPDVNKLYVSNSAVDGTRQVQSGSLVVNTIRIEEYFEDFEGAWNSSSCFSDFYTFKPELDRTKKTDAPGKTLVTYQMEQPVITCEEAAVERGVPLEHELKTLIIQTSTERVAVHLCGDSSLSLRKVKNFLESSESYLVDPETLFELGMSAGTVSALLDPVWSMPHLISSRVLRLDYVTTNNGTRTGYFKFSPNLLLTAQNIQEGDFEK